MCETYFLGFHRFRRLVIKVLQVGVPHIKRLVWTWLLWWRDFKISAGELQKYYSNRPLRKIRSDLKNIMGSCERDVDHFGCHSDLCYLSLYVFCYSEFTIRLYIVIIWMSFRRALTVYRTYTYRNLCVCEWSVSKRVSNVDIKRTAKPKRSATKQRNDQHIHVILYFTE